ncbi:MAG: hypothetical protein JSW21_04195 [Gammaproteobacteria bacterium]|nr:MAG: hypothetical protein JSW21_04195 [Gammaproteobacteria bacterium]
MAELSAEGFEGDQLLLGLHASATDAWPDALASIATALVIQLETPDPGNSWTKA